MYESPSRLQHFCLEYICENVDVLCEDLTDTETHTTTLYFKNGNIFFPGHLSEQLLDLLCDKNKLTDRTMALFNVEYCQLKRVRIKNAPLSLPGLCVLKGHKILELEASGLRKVSVHDLLSCLSDWTLSNLRTLNVANGTFINGSKFCLMVSLQKLKALQSLNVSNTEFNVFGLEVVAQELTSLENLDISLTRVSDITPLKKCQRTLKSLNLYNLNNATSQQSIKILCQLTQLRHLDVSTDGSVYMESEPSNLLTVELLRYCGSLPQLTSLDISGWHIDSKELEEFLMRRKGMCFLGIFLTDLSSSPMFTEDDHEFYCPQRKVTGETTEKQLLEALRRYGGRQKFVHRSLFHLFQFTQTYTTPRLDIIQLVLKAMRAHLSSLNVQMAATACLYNLSKKEPGQHIQPRVLAEVVSHTLDAMEKFPTNRQLQQNALLTLCSDRILQDVPFDRYRCACLVLDCLCRVTDANMTRMAVAICGILAAKIPTEQTSRLGSQEEYMKRLLAIVKEKTEIQSKGRIIRFTLSALWNLTDESPGTCRMFLENNGLELFLNALETYKDEVQVETKVLGLINNVAEVPELRSQLMTDRVIHAVSELMHSSHTDVSYFSAGILSHLISDPVFRSQNLVTVSREELFKELESVVLGWKQPEGEMVAYRSFCPFLPLLRRTVAPQVQLWSAWAIQHVCTRNSRRYCKMLVCEGGAVLLEELANSQDTYPPVQRLAASVVEIVENQLGPEWRQLSTP